MKFEPLKAGALNQYVAIEAEQRVSNGRGGFTSSWLTVGNAYAEIIPLRGDEALRHAAERAIQIYKVTIRYWPGLTTQHRLMWNGRALDIRQLGDPFGRGDRWVMTCEAGTGI